MGAFAILLWASLTLAGCGGEGEVPRALLELERMAFLPPAAVAPSRDLRGVGVSEALLVDRYEVTRGEWKRYLAQAPGPVAPPLAQWVRDWKADTDSWPASFMTLSEAQQFARWRGLRLLTSMEWTDCGLESGTWLYPWGMTWQDSVANTLELRLERPTPVGTFESGRSAIGCYDMLGNVAEWVSDDAPEANPGAARALAMGRSFRQYGRHNRDPAQAWAGGGLHPDSRSDSVGLRCGVEAAGYLWDRAADWGTGDAALRRRLVALGRRWGRRSLPLLEELVARPGAPEGLRALAEGARL